MATYYLALGVSASTANDPQSDGTHLDGQYGYAMDSGSGAQPLGNSGSTGRQFEAVQIGASGNGANQSAFMITLFTSYPNNDPNNGIDTNNSWIRVAFRPAHDVAPSPSVDDSPLSGGDTDQLMDGQTLASLTSVAQSSNGGSFGLPTTVSYQNCWQFATRLSGSPNSSAHFEVTAEITIQTLNGTKYYFKVDPEMMIDF